MSITIYFLFKYREHFILFIPLFTILIDVSAIIINEFDPTQTSYFEIFLSYFRGFIFLLLLFIILRKRKLIRTDFGFLIFSLLLIILSFTSSDPWTSIKTTLLVISYLSLLVSGYYYFKFQSNLTFLKSKLRIVLIVYIINALIFSIVGIGLEYYTGSIIFLGSVPLFASYGIIFSIILILAWLGEVKRNDILLIILNLGVIILIYKRAPILLFLIGLSIILYYNRKLFRKPKFLISFLIISLISTPVIYYSIKQAVNTRDKAGTLDITDEGRYKEYQILFDEIIKSTNRKIFFFGKDLFNNTEFGEDQDILYTENRNLHSDYAILLRGSGVVGLALYLTIFLNMFRKFYRLKKTKQLDKQIISAFAAIFLCLFINGFIDSLTVSTARAIPFLFLGSLLGTMDSIVYKYKAILTP